MRWISRLTTVAIVVTLVASIALLVRSKIPDVTAGGGFRTYAMFRDASRLQVGSSVMVAGVRVGDITGLTIQGRFARVDMRLSEQVQLPVDTFARRRSDSLFGDNYIELVPSSATDQVVYLKDGEPIRFVEDGGSTDAMLRAIARTMPKIDEALETVDQVMTDGRRWVNGPLVERLDRVQRWLDDGSLSGPLASADRAMEAFESGTTAAADAVHSAAPGIPKRLEDFDRAIREVRADMKDAKASLQTALADARAGFDRVDEPIADMAEVMASIDEGRGDDWKGTLGRLVNDPSLSNTLEDFTGDVAAGAAGLVRFRSWIGGRFEAGLRAGDVRTYATAEVYTRTDKLYLVEFSYSNFGTEPLQRLTDAPGNPSFTQTVEISDRFRFTAQFGKRFGWFQGRIGIKDSTPGIGADALFGNGRLRLSADVFGSFERTPRLKLAGALAVFRSIYILAGVDDALNAPGSLSIRTGSPDPAVPGQFERLNYGRDFFLGATLQFSDADLATILRFYGALVLGYAVGR